jgi:hypothetical protein
MNNKFFLDASFAIALSSAKDRYHDRSEILAKQMQETRAQMVTSRAVVLEIGNVLAKRRYRKAAIKLIESIEEDPSIEIVPVSEELYKRAFSFYKKRQDKEWGLTDCISFVVMQDYELNKALTADEHFRQAGFRALLLED